MNVGFKVIWIEMSGKSELIFSIGQQDVFLKKIENLNIRRKMFCSWLQKMEEEADNKIIVIQIYLQTSILYEEQI